MALETYILRGRVVTMDQPGGTVIADGLVYIHRERILRVCPAVGAQPPAGFNPAAPLIDTQGSIYPGLIELHNHLSYDFLPLWRVPETFPNRQKWMEHDEKSRLISGPAQVLGRSQGLPPAITRYVEVKCLLAGVTTSQGISLMNANIKRYYKGLVRNVEQKSIPALPFAVTNVDDVKPSGAPAFLTKLKQGRKVLLHLSEGTDDRSRSAFQALHLPDGSWAINDKLIGIHCAALRAEHFAVMANLKASMVWSPMSNLLLYGDTADVAAAKAAGVALALGSDWSPSGSKNLLGELKIASLYSQAQGNLFTAEELAAMVTRTPAEMIGWQHELGTVQENKRADLLVLRGAAPDPYRQLIDAIETDVALVIIEGIPRYGRAGLIAPFNLNTENISVAGETRKLHLEDPAADPLTQGLTLHSAVATLEDSLQHLHDLALLVDHAVAQGTVGLDAAGQPFTVLDLDQEGTPGLPSHLNLLAGDSTFEEHLILLAGKIAYADLLQDVHITLDPLTVPDDAEFFQRIADQTNLEGYYKQGLAAAYGAVLPPPQGGAFIRRMHPAVRPQFAAATTLADLLRRGGLLTLAERRLLVEQALILLERFYVHLPLKRAMHAVDPVQRLKLLLYQLEQQDDDTMEPEMEFHKEMMSIFNGLRDLHTNYLTPLPFGDKTAFLPFLIEEYYENGQRHYIVSKMLKGVATTTFKVGVEVLYWNGVPIDREVERNAERQAGSNPAARHARGIDALTIRALIRSLPPDEEWVTLRYRTGDGQEHTFTQEWLVFSPESEPGGVDPAGGSALAAALGFDLQTDRVSRVKKILYKPKAVAEERLVQAARLSGRRKQAAVSAGDLTTGMPSVFRACPVENGRYGYIRIFTFNVDNDETFLREFIRLVEALPQDGLIIDVRNNGGGLIYAAERLLQTLTPRRIEPQRAQFINSPLTLALCKANNPSSRYQGFSLGQWIESINQSVATGATYSLSFPITDPQRCNNTGQRYFGPVVLIVDALCYSATDLFAAGFQDHQVGKIIGASSHTGAGGANVWTHALLDQLMRSAQPPFPPLPDSPFKPLPRGAGMRVAARATLRTGTHMGVPVEDLGVQPDLPLYRMTRSDVLDGNVDLIHYAAGVLSGMKVYRLDYQPGPVEGSCLSGIVKTHNLTQLDFYLGGRPLGSLLAREGENPFRLELPPGAGAAAQLRIEGWDGDTLAAVRVW